MKFARLSSIPLTDRYLLSAAACGFIGGTLIISSCKSEDRESSVQPNILIAISDDQSFAHTSFAGCKFISTPAFDKVAKSGIYFKNCWAASPGSAPSRSALVTGRYHWQNEQSGQHASSWMKKYVPFVDELKENGYHTGATGKGVGPFQYVRNDGDSLWRKEDAAGKPYNKIRYVNGSDERTASGIGAINYSANFREFMKEIEPGQPFYFWYGANEPHRVFEKDSWKRNGKELSGVEVPGFLPDNEIIRGDLLDYAVEIEWFDLHLARMLDHLDSIGELGNTIVIVTGDNGMAFPSAKAFFTDYGVHVPLAVSYPLGFPGGRTVEDPVSFSDFAPTLLELTGTKPQRMMPISGRSFAEILKSRKSGVVDESRKYVFAGRERHSSSRWNNLGYPVRAIRSREFMLVWNIKPYLWPAGDPQSYISGTAELAPMYGIGKDGKHNSEWAFTDIDASPSKSFVIENFDDPVLKKYFDLATAKKPEFELFNVLNDPFCLKNIAGDPAFKSIEAELKTALHNELVRSGDPRVVGPDKEVFESYPRFSPIREFPEHELVAQPSLADHSFFEKAMNGEEAEVMKLLTGGIDVNIKDEDGRTALMYAAYNGHASLMEKLIAKGAQVNLRDNYGRTALMLASSGPFASAVKLLLENGADPNITDTEEHFSALMYAAAEGQAEVVRLLLKYKADPRLKDVDGDNALTFARNNGHKEVSDLLGSYR
jgi:N-sulfoglucosamine sulfohydrolase